MRIICIYNNQNLSGLISLGIVIHWFLETYKPTGHQPIKNLNGEMDMNDPRPALYILSYKKGDDIPDLFSYNKVIMVDVSFNMSEMTRLSHELGNNFIWIDHHISSINEWNKVIEPNPNNWHIGGIRDIKFTTPELTWKYFFPYVSMPEIVKFLIQ